MREGTERGGGEMPTPFSSFSNSRFKEKNTILRVEDTYKERKANREMKAKRRTHGY